MGSVLYNPFEHAFVESRDRVDEGVDYHMNGGYLSAIGPGRVIYSSAHPSGWPGQYVAYQLNGVTGLDGAVIYYAEGISGLPNVGTIYQGGEGVCFCTPGASIEIGLGSTNPPNSYDRQNGGGYDQKNSTRAGIWFNQLLASVGAPTGIVQGSPTGPEPPYSISGVTSIVGGVLTTGQLLKLYNPSTIIRHAFYQFGQYGRAASAYAYEIRALMENANYTTNQGVN